MTTSAFFPTCRRPPPGSTPPTKVSSTSTAPGQTVPARLDHRTSKLVQPRPCGSIAAQAEDSLQSQRAGAVLLADDPPDSSEPGHQRRLRILEERAGGHRRLLPTAPAHPEPPPGAPRLSSLAGGTHESVRPPESCEVVAARFLRGEEGLELLKRPRIVLHTPDYYLWGLLESREYPLFFQVTVYDEADMNSRLSDHVYSSKTSSLNAPRAPRTEPGREIEYFQSNKRTHGD